MPDYSRVILSPVVCFAGAFAAGVAANHLAPMPLPLIAVVTLLSGVCLIVAALIALLAIGALIHARTTVLPWQRAKALVTTGPYRFSRNPMYVALVLLYLSLSGWIGLAWPLFFLPLAVWIVHVRIIPFEEQGLIANFGKQYLNYASRVRRWL